MEAKGRVGKGREAKGRVGKGREAKGSEGKVVLNLKGGGAPGEFLT